MAAKKTRAQKLVDSATKSAKKRADRFTKSVEGVIGQTEKLRDNFEKRAEETTEQTRKRAIRLTLSAVDFQKTTFDSAFGALSRLQSQSEDMVGGMLNNADWLPKEGKAVSKEWVKLLRAARSDFKDTVDKSFDLISDYLERVEAGKPSKKKAAKKKAAPKKKSTAKRKPAAKKKTAAKRKTAAKKKTAAKRKPAARKKATAKK